MAGVIQNQTQNWALFTTTWEPALADKPAFFAVEEQHRLPF
ncbi:hypothetical protein [Burkholderia ubonensis]|nr:hypothetical protein [Burkholderia ubonensis]